MAVANYHDTYGTFPPAYLADENGKPMHSWRVILLPFLEQGALYDQYDFNEPWDGPNNRKLLDQRPRVYAFSHEQKKPGIFTNYVAVLGDRTVWPYARSRTMAEIKDDTLYTILVVENEGGEIPWLEPRDLEYATMNMSVRDEAANGVSSRYSPPAMVTVAGSVHTLSMDLAPQTLRALLTVDGGEQLEFDGQFREILDGRLRPLKPEPKDERSELLREDAERTPGGRNEALQAAAPRTLTRDERAARMQQLSAEAEAITRIVNSWKVRCPPRTEQSDWNAACDVVRAAVVNTAYPSAVSLEQMRRLREEVEQRDGKAVGVETLEWLLDQIFQTGVSGARYILRNQPSLTEALHRVRIPSMAAPR